MLNRWLRFASGGVGRNKQGRASLRAAEGRDALEMTHDIARSDCSAMSLATPDNK